MQVRKNRASLCSLGIRTESQGGLFKQETERRATAVSVSVVSSVDGSLFTVFLCKLVGVLHEFRAVFTVFLCQVGPQRMLRLRRVHQVNETLNHWRREGTRRNLIYAQKLKKGGSFSCILSPFKEES